MTLMPLSKEIGFLAPSFELLMYDGAAYISSLITLIKSMSKDAPEPFI